jgi:serine/threonine protein kinase
MDIARWEQIQSIFHQALEVPESERSSFLEIACGGDAELVSEVDAMLRTDRRETSLLDRGLRDVVHHVLSSPAAAIGQQEFGPYRLLRVLGEGGMGVVWLAQRQDAGNLVAIKFLPHAGLSPARRERFTQEIKTLGKLKHPFIARLYDAGALSDGTPWFVMEYVQGVRFADYCREQQLSIEDRLRLFRSVCEAVQYAHGQEIIHRDLKPSNILVDESGAPRLLDFGIARELGGLQSPAEQTQPGLRFLSPDYAAPEWIREGDVGFYTDVYSLGVILYEILSGQLPFDRSQASTDGQVFADAVAPSIAVRRGPQAKLAGQLSKAAWADLDVLCLKAMHKDARQRYSSAEALIRDIDHYLQGEPLEARPDSVRYRAGKFVRRNLRSLAAASAALMLLIGLVTFYTVRLAKERNRASHEAAITAAMNRFLTDDLLAQGDPYKSAKAHPSFVDVVSRASPRIDLQFSNEPLVAARLHQTLARAFDGETDCARARQEYDRADQLFLRSEGSLSQDALVLRLQRADMEVRCGDPGSLETAQSILKDAEASISRISQPRADLGVYILTARALIAYGSGDSRTSIENFDQALRQAQQVPSFDAAALLRIKQRLAFMYLRAGDGAKAETLLHQVIDGFSKIGGPDNPNALPAYGALVQALQGQRKHAEAIQAADLTYPKMVSYLGADHAVPLAMLGARASAEAALHLWDPAIRDDLAIYEISARKQGENSLFSLAFLTDAATWQCRSGRNREGEANARQALLAARKAFGEHAGIAAGASYALATCLINQNNLAEAASLLERIDAKALAEMSLDSDTLSEIDLARATIAARRGDYASADRYAQAAAPVLDRPDADSIDRQALHDLRSVIDKNLRAAR